MNSNCLKSCSKENTSKGTNPNSKDSKCIDTLRDATNGSSDITVLIDESTLFTSPIVIEELGKDGAETKVNRVVENVKLRTYDNGAKNNKVCTVACDIVKKATGISTIVLDDSDPQNEAVLDTGNNKQTSRDFIINYTTDSDATKGKGDPKKNKVCTAPFYKTKKNNTAINTIILVDSEPQNEDLTTGNNQTSYLRELVINNADKKYDPTVDSDVDVYEIELENVIDLDENRIDSDVIVLDSKVDSEKTIILDNTETAKPSENYPLIDLDAEKDKECSIVEPSSSNQNNLYNNLFLDNSLLSELVEKCLAMENCGGMDRVINRTLLTIYKNVDGDYKKSEAFRKVLTRTLMKLDLEPEWKFSHIKNLCDHLKRHKVKKRVSLINLEKEGNIGDQSTSTPTKRRRVEAIIDLDNYSEKSIKPKEYPPIEIDDDSNSDVFPEEVCHDVIIVDEYDNTNKMNNKKTKAKRKGKNKARPRKQNVANQSMDLPSGKTKRGRPRKHFNSSINHQCANSKPRTHSKDPQITLDRESRRVPHISLEFTSTQLLDSNLEPDLPLDTESLLKPVITVPFSLTDPNPGNMLVIKNIEEKIAKLKQRVETLDEMEVNADDDMSPYLISENVQAHILHLYKKLCELTGTEDRKQHKVRLQVLPGHPAGPVRRLENFLNDNIDADGNPPFPDLHDVIGCVSQANAEDNMNWGEAQIANEARALFIQLGRTMQKRRQKREYKDLMGRVKQEARDPADDDPELMRKLEENSRIAKLNEDALLDSYAKREYMKMTVTMDSNIEESDYDDTVIHEPMNHQLNSRTVVPLNNLVINGVSEHPPCHTVPMNTMEYSGASKTPPAQQSLWDESRGMMMISDTVSANTRVNTDRPGCAYVVTRNAEYSITALNGKIVIQPTMLNPPGALSQNINTTTICKEKFVSEFQRFINDKHEKEKTNPNVGLLTNSRQNIKIVKEIDKYEKDKYVGWLTDSGEMKIVKEIDCSNGNNQSEYDSLTLANANSLAREILELVQKDITPVNNLTNKKDYNIGKVVEPTELNAINANGFDVLTHTTKFKITENTQSKELPSKVLETATNEMNNIEDVVKSEPSDIPSCDKTNGTNMESPQTENMDASENYVKPEPLDIPSCNETNNVELPQTENINVSEDNVKPEPLDIPSMLQELGDGYTSVLFDIEDPFLVIEISDSSDSDSEGT